MHPLLVLLAFSIAAVVTYGVVLAVLTATSVVDDDAGDDPADDPADDPSPHDDSEELVHAGR